MHERGPRRYSLIMAVELLRILKGLKVVFILASHTNETLQMNRTYLNAKVLAPL